MASRRVAPSAVAAWGFRLGELVQAAESTSKGCLVGASSSDATSWSWLMQQRLRLPEFCRQQHTSAEAVAAGAPGAQQSPSPAASSTQPSSSSVPWPWVDPSKPQVLPKQIRVERPEPVALTDALQQLLGGKVVPFHSVEFAARFQLDPRRSDHLVRGSVLLPHGTGRKVRLVVFASGLDAELARKEGVEIIGDEALIQQIIQTNGACIKFDKLIATPEFIKHLAKAGKVLGPKGLMPNPKMGTLTTDVVKSIGEMRRGRLDYRLGRDGAIRGAIGKAGMPQEQLAANVASLADSLLQVKPKGAMDAAAAGDGSNPFDGYLQRFLLRTTFRAPLVVSTASLAEAAAKYAQAAKAAARAGAAQAQQQPGTAAA